MLNYIIKTLTILIIIFPIHLFAQNKSMETPIREESKDLQFKIDVGGIVRLNGIYDFQGLQNISDFTTFLIPVPSGNKDNRFALSARQTRLFVQPEVFSPIGKIKGYIEADFYSDNTESSSIFRLRFAYIQWKGFTIGQSFTAFVPEETEPILVDFESPPSFSVKRIPLIRWVGQVSEQFQLGISIENPIFDYTPIMDNKKPYAHMPDFLVLGRYEKTRYFLQSAFLLREIRYEIQNDIRKSKYGWGVSLGGVYKLLKQDQINFFVAGGQGISSYFSDLAGAKLDAYPSSMDNLNLLPAIGWFASYRRQWNEKTFSQATFAMLNLSDISAQPMDAFRSSTYIALNYFYEPIPIVRTGIEGLYGQRVNKNKESGDAYRINFLIQISF